MAEVSGPDIDILCAGILYSFSAIDAGSCQIIEWVSVTRPAGVSEEDITYTARNSLDTQISVPVQGLYSFAIRCGV